MAQDIFVIVLGVAQDAGVPHIGCHCPRCQRAWANPAAGHLPAAAAIVDCRREPIGVWLVDATPAIKAQLERLALFLGPNPSRPSRLRQPDALFLSHAHMGHVGGLMQLGPEGMHVRGLPIYASAPLCDRLNRTPLWSPLLSGQTLQVLTPNRPVPLAPDLQLTPILVPHRDELGTGTFAFLIEGPARSLLYLPDIDDWHAWPDAPAALAGVDIALVDASFYTRAELGGRAPVAHPLVPETLTFFQKWPGRLVLTHVNHTNPILDAGSPELAAVEAAGAEVAFGGQIFTLD